MGTQRTGMGGSGNLPPTKPNDELDLGIPENVEMSEDPTGYVPPTPVETVAGRPMRRLERQHLAEAHQRYAGNTTIMGETIPPDNPTRTERPARPVSNAPSMHAQEEARRLMPDAFKVQQAQPPHTPVNEPQYNPSNAQVGVNDTLKRINKDEAKSAATTFAYLSEAENKAREEGDFGSAAQAKRMAQGLQADYDFVQKEKPKTRHPALGKLLANLGLEKIKPAELEWAGSKWMFAPTNAAIDYWVTRNMTDDGLNLAALFISSSLVGIDDVPLYEVLNIPLTKTYEVSVKDPKARHEPITITIPLYKKYCTCGNEIAVEAERCDLCGALQNKFDMPLELRMLCANKFNKMLEEEFGAYEALHTLLALKNEVMKDRRLDLAELYPLAVPSQKEAKQTQD